MVPDNRPADGVRCLRRVAAEDGDEREHERVGARRVVNKHEVDGHALGNESGIGEERLDEDVRRVDVDVGRLDVGRRDGVSEGTRLVCVCSCACGFEVLGKCHT